jgi:hypothetical protein
MERRSLLECLQRAVDDRKAAAGAQWVRGGFAVYFLSKLASELSASKRTKE